MAEVQQQPASAQQCVHAMTTYSSAQHGHQKVRGVFRQPGVSRFQQQCRQQHLACSCASSCMASFLLVMIVLDKLLATSPYLRVPVAAVPAVPTKGVADPDPTNVDLPVNGFGSWTFPQTENGCQYSFDSDSTSDAWPYGLCSLKRVADPKNPKLYKTQGVCLDALLLHATALLWRRLPSL